MSGTAGKDLSLIITELDANVNRAVALTEGLSGNQFNWHPEPGRWSIGQNLSHLIVTNGPDLFSLQRAIEAGCAEAMTGKSPFHYGFLSRKFVESMEPPVKRKFKAPSYFEPPPHLEKDPTLAEYRRISTELKRLAEAADGLHLDCVKVELSAFPPILRAMIKMPLGARFELLTAHDRRHLAQAEGVRKQSNFPRD
jgi:hypothetical protein